MTVKRRGLNETALNPCSVKILKKEAMEVS